MWKLLVLLALSIPACAHDERGGTNAEDVPPPLAVQQNAIPNDMPPATPPIPKTAASAPPAEGATQAGEVEVNPAPGARRARKGKRPPPRPLPAGQPVQAPEPVAPGH